MTPSSAAKAVDSGSDKLLGYDERPVGWMVFNNPERRNAVSLEMWAAMPRVMGAFDADPDIRAIVLTGAGDRAFVAGADISQFEENRDSAAANASYKGVSDAGFAAILDTPKPTIAMISGYCIGGGMAIALNCDIRIAADDARFAIPAGKLGLAYPQAGVERLVGIVGPAFAKEIFYTARQYSAAEALAMGLVNRVVAKADLEATVREYAQMIGANAPLTLSASKISIDETMKDPALRDMAKVEAAAMVCFDSEDYAEGRRAFMEKRAPVFRGR